MYSIFNSLPSSWCWLLISERYLSTRNKKMWIFFSGWWYSWSLCGCEFDFCRRNRLLDRSWFGWENVQRKNKTNDFAARWQHCINNQQSKARKLCCKKKTIWIKCWIHFNWWTFLCQTKKSISGWSHWMHNN